MSIRRLLAGLFAIVLGAGMVLATPGTSRAEVWPPPPQPYEGTWGVDYFNFEDTANLPYDLRLKVSTPEYAPGHYPTMTEVCNDSTWRTVKVGFDNWATTGPSDGDTWFIDPKLPSPYWAGWPVTPMEIGPGLCATKFITSFREPAIVHFIHPITGKRYDVLPATEWDGIPKVGWPRSYGSTMVWGDMTSDARADVLGLTNAGQWYAYTANPGPALTSAGQPTNPPPGCCINFITKTPDLDRNGFTDYLWRGASSGSLVYQPVMGTKRFGQQRIVGTGWNNMSLITVVNDVNGDGNPEIIARAADGRLLRYKFNRTGTITGPNQIGSNWQHITTLVSIGDASGDGIPDLIAIKDDGTLLRYNLTSTGLIGSTKVIGRGWSSMRQVVSPGDLDRSGRNDLISIRSDGKLYYYNHLGLGRFAAAQQIGTGWNGMKYLS